MTDFKDFGEVLNHVEATIVISLIDHAVSLDEVLERSLNAPVPGLYLPGEFEPLFATGEEYVTRQALDLAKIEKATAAYEGTLKNSNGTTTNFETSKFKGGVVNQNGLTSIPSIELIPKLSCDIYRRSDMKQIVTVDQMRNVRRHLRPEPTVPSVAIKMALLLAKQRLSSYCSHAAIPPSRYNQFDLVKTEHHHLVLGEEFNQGFSDLLEEIRMFISGHEWSLYFIQVKGSSLFIKRGIDWRIAEWYRMKFEKEEKDS